MQIKKKISCLWLLLFLGGLVVPLTIHETIAEDDQPKKIGIFLAAPATITGVFVDEFTEALDAEGYTTIDKRIDKIDVESFMSDIAEDVNEQDTVFVYLDAHGVYYPDQDNSVLGGFNSLGELVDSYITSEEFRVCMDGLAAEHKALLVASCYAKGWLDDFDDDPYLVISSSYGSPSYIGPKHVQYFSQYFWEAVEDHGKNAIVAFEYAKAKVLEVCKIKYLKPDMDPCYSDNCDYTFFNSAPYKPETPSGPSTGYQNQLLTFGFKATDPNGDLVSYQINWGDSSIINLGFSTSGKKVYMNHRYIHTGTYYIKVRAKDEYGLWSSWSSGHKIVITISGPF